MDDNAFSRRQALGRLGFVAAGAAAASSLGAEATNSTSPGTFWNVRDFKATGDGKTKDTAAIQKAIDAANAAGGGTAFVPNGIYVCGTIQLRDNVTLYLAEGATILGSTAPEDYLLNSTGSRRAPVALVLAQNARKIAITGRGTINGRGGSFIQKDNAPGRPFGIKFIECKDVLLADVRVEDAAAWVIHLLACERAVVRGVRVWSHANYNNDGLDIDACTDVTVSQCHFDCQDDAICLKSTPDRICENILVSDCLASSHCNLIKMGTASTGGFKNVTITNCALVAPRYSKKINGADRGIGGINLELVDGGVMDRITISNITMDGITLPLFIRLGSRKRKADAAPSTLRNVIISNIVATNLGMVGGSITGLPGQNVENVTLSNLQFSYEGGGTAEDARRAVPERAEAYPEGWMFGTLPAWGLYCRHVKGLKLQNVLLRLAAPDARHALVFDDVEELEVDGLDCACSPGAASLVKLSRTRSATIRGCRPQAPEGVFLKLEGKENTGVALLANDLRQAGKWLETDADAAKDAVAQAGNLMA
ncbi:MAG TPA: glycosyl hydrolase family 28 protein [Candidatus Binatia bacterium]|jgi:polygalacturonase|nr:glycosyl hydrolase family 28 protein [Candidatus Binatia bacterium]